MEGTTDFKKTVDDWVCRKHLKQFRELAVIQPRPEGLSQKTVQTTPGAGCHSAKTRGLVSKTLYKQLGPEVLLSSSQTQMAWTSD